MRRCSRSLACTCSAVLLGAVMVLAWGCASSTCHVEGPLKSRLEKLGRDLKPLERAQDFGLYGSSDLIGLEVADIRQRVDELSRPEACGQVTDATLTVLERRLGAATDAVLGKCLDEAAQKRVELIQRGVEGVEPAYPTDLGQCLGRLEEFDGLANAGASSRGARRPCAAEPATLEEVRKAVSAGDQGALRRLEVLANQRLTDLERRLTALIEAGAEPSATGRRALEKDLECAGSWIVALGDRKGLEHRYRQLRHRLGELDEHRRFLAVCASVMGEADAGSLETLGREELERRRQQVLGGFEQLMAPTSREADLKATVLSAINHAEEIGFRRRAVAAIASCDQESFRAAMDGLQGLGVEAADLEDRFRTACTENVEELAVRLQASLDAFGAAMGRQDIAAQDRAMEAFLAEAKTADSLSPEGRRQLGQRVDLEAVGGVRACAEALLEGDRALNAGDLSTARSAYRRAEGMAGCTPGRLRKARLDRARARHLWRQGDLEGAWSLLSAGAGALGADGKRELVELAREGVRSAAAGSSAGLRWLRRLRQCAGLDGMMPEELLELAGIAADRAAQDPEVWREAWDALAAYFHTDPVAPPLDAFILASRIAHALDVLGRGWASGSWQPGAAVHIDRFVTWCERYGPRLGPDMAVRLKNLVSYQEVLYLASEALRSLWDASQELDPARRQRVRDAVLRKLLESISHVPLVRSAGIGVPSAGAKEEIRGLIGRAMAGGLAVSRDGRLVAASAATPWGKLVMVFDSSAVAGTASSPSQIADLLAVARARALGTIAGILVEMTSGRTDLSISRRKAAVADIIQGLRFRMGSNVLAYGGLFNRNGMLEVPDRAGQFFLDRDLIRAGVPVFQDAVSRKAVAADSITVQRYDLKGRRMADVAVPIRRGRNRLGVLRLGVIQTGGPQR